MTKKIFTYIFSTALFSILITSFIVITICFAVISNDTKQNLNSELKLVAKEFDNKKTIQEKKDYLSLLSLYSNYRFTLLNVNGEVLFDSEKNISEMDNHLERPEIQDAINNGYGESQRYSSTISEKTIYKSILLNNDLILRISILQKSIWLLLFTIIEPLLFIISIFMILSGVLSLSFSKKIISPISKIDLDSPEESIVYEELIPFVKKITKQKNKIKENLKDLKKQQDDFELIISKMKDGLIIIDANEYILSINDSAKKYFNSNLSDYKGKHILSVNRSFEFKNAIQHTLSTEQSFDYEDFIDNRYLFISTSPVFEKEILTGCVVFIRNVTEKKQSENLRKEFSANVSHELKTPLTSILGFAEIIKSGVAESKDVPEFANRIYDEASRMKTLIQDIINLSNLDENHQKINCNENIDLNEIIYLVTKNLNEQIVEKKIELVFDIDNSKNYFIKGNKIIIEQMIYNICDNAIKYNVNEGKIFITLNYENNKLVLKIKDTGIGIPKSEFENIFQRFYRVDKSRSRETGGTGLGLSIVKHGAILHNALVKIDSEVGKWTELSLEF